MAKASDIIARLKTIVPKLTNLFSDTVSISSLTRVGGTVTAVTATAHGLTTGNYINIAGAQAPVQITTLTSANGIASATTSAPHDLTKAPDEPYTPPIKVQGADQSEYNGSALTLLSVPNRYSFTYQISGTPVSPATGNTLLFDGRERGYNGKKQIAVVDATTFTYAISEVPLSPAIGTITAQLKTRISGGITLDRCIQAYSAQISATKLWAFVVLGDVTSNKDRQVFSDASYSPTPGIQFQQRIFQPFHIFVVVKAVDEIAGRSVRDLMEDVAPIFYKTLLKFGFPTGLENDNPFLTSFAGHSYQEYAEAYYVHAFSFLTQCDITEDDVSTVENVAFRDLDLTITNSPDEPIDNEVNLDDDPV